MKNKTKRRLKIIGITLLLLFIGGEIYLRKVWGFCDAPLFQTSEHYEYIAQPNQQRYRFGSHIRYNAYSQRSDEPDPSKSIILGFGDSVLYGGTMVDQDSLATTLFSKLSGKQLLNISCGSWGPDNCAAYLKEFGPFDAKAFLLVVSSHDAHDNMDFMPVVGIQPTYPDHEYPLAWLELFDRYLNVGTITQFFPKKVILDPDQRVLQGQEIHKNGIPFNTGFQELKHAADSLHIPFFVYLHPEQSEVTQKCYNEEGKQIINWCRQYSVPLFQELTANISPNMYRDQIHFNEKGQKFMAQNFTALLAPIH